MHRLLISLAGICICVSGYSQKVEDLKKSSGGHNSGSGYSGSSSSEIDPACIIDGCNALSNILSLIDWRNLDASETKPNQPLEKQDTQNYYHNKENIPKEKLEKEQPFETMALSVRGSFYPSKYHIWVPEISGSKGHFSYSARFLSIAEQRLDKMDYYSTFDVQPLQINFINQHNVLVKVGIGCMAETFSDKVYFEFTTNTNWRMGQKFDMGIEGRMATDHGIVRQEASLHANYALWQKENKQFLVGLNGMVSEYYQAVDINTISFSAGFRF
jgi:hypothetical protein